VVGKARQRAKVNVNARNEKGDTALHLAASHHHPVWLSITLNLLLCGASVDAKDAEGLVGTVVGGRGSGRGRIGEKRWSGGG